MPALYALHTFLKKGIVNNDAWVITVHPYCPATEKHLPFKVAAANGFRLLTTNVHITVRDKKKCELIL